MKYLFDTNACLDFLLKRSDRLIARMGTVVGQVSVSAVTAAELRVGAKASTDPDADDKLLDVFLTAVGIEPFDSAAATAYGDMIRRVGMQRGSYDCLIAAHALALNAVVVTNNTRDFADVPGLIVENWTQ